MQLTTAALPVFGTPVKKVCLELRNGGEKGVLLCVLVERRGVVVDCDGGMGRLNG